MTLPSVTSWQVAGARGPKYKVGPYCSVSTCGRPAEHVHHIVRRSRIAGAYDWVTIDGRTVGNLTGLCVEHHNDVTGRIGGHKAAIRYLDGVFYWCRIENFGDEIEYWPEEPLVPQPPTPDSLATRTSVQTESDDCPFCGQSKRRRSPSPTGGERRRRKTWTIKVPADDEDGATVLDTLIEDLAPVLNVQNEGEYRYYVVVPALVFAQQNQRELVESLRGRGA